MGPDEYDALIADPEAYFRRALLPRFGSAFAPLAGLAPFSDMMEAASMPFNILPFADPAVVEGVQQLAEAARESFAWLRATGAADADAAGRLGIPPEVGGLGQGPLRRAGRHAPRNQGHHDRPLPAAGQDPGGGRALRAADDRLWVCARRRAPKLR